MIKAYKYKYNSLSRTCIGSKELQNELDLNWYDYGARNYDAALGRFMNVDPFTEKYNFQSPYVYAANNPVFFVDINGMGVDDWYKVLDKNGKETEEIVWIDGDKNLTDKGYKHLDFNVTAGETDVNGNRTIIDYKGNNKSSYKYNSETATWELLHDYKKDINYTSFDKWAENNNINIEEEISTAAGLGVIVSASEKKINKSTNPKKTTPKPTIKGTIQSIIISASIGAGIKIAQLLGQWNGSLTPLEQQHRKNLEEIGKKIQEDYGKDQEE